MLSLLAIVLLIATLMTLFYQQISRGIGSAVFVIVWLLCGFLASWLFHPVSLICLPPASLCSTTWTCDRNSLPNRSTTPWPR